MQPGKEDMVVEWNVGDILMALGMMEHFEQVEGAPGRLGIQDSLGRATVEHLPAKPRK